MRISDQNRTNENVLPEYFHLKNVPWQLFITLTFKDDDARERHRKPAAFFLLRKIAESAPKQHFKELLWCLRWEKSSAYGVGHYHACVAGITKSKISSAFCRLLEDAWFRRTGSIAQICEYESALDGIRYVLKVPQGPLARSTWEDAKHTMEFEEFQPTLSESLQELLQQKAR